MELNSNDIIAIIGELLVTRDDYDNQILTSTDIHECVLLERERIGFMKATNILTALLDKKIIELHKQK